MKHTHDKDCPLPADETCDRAQCMMRCRWCNPIKKSTFARFHDAFLEQGGALEMAGNMNHIVFLLDGILRIRMNGADNTLSAGHLIFFSRSEDLQITAEEPSLVVWLDFNNRVVFDGQDCLAALAALPRRSIPESTILEIRPAIHYLLTLLRMMIHDNEDSRCYHALKEYELFMYLWQEYSPEERIALFHEVAHPRDDLRAFMLNNYNPTLCEKDYAKLICVSRSTFSRRFFNTFGMPFYKWMVKQKEDDLRDALATGIMDTKELAQRLGFINVLSFYRFCRNHFGCSFQSLADNLAINPQSVGHSKPK
jgi:AraC-like DNA-binding protein